MASHDGMQFTTVDVDNDMLSGDNCAVVYTGGWWYNSCHQAHPTGRWYPTPTYSNWGVSGDYCYKAIQMSLTSNIYA